MERSFNAVHVWMVQEPEEKEIPDQKGAHENGDKGNNPGHASAGEAPGTKMQLASTLQRGSGSVSSTRECVGWGF